MNNQEFGNLYTKQEDIDEDIFPFTSGTGFTLIKKYHEKTPFKNFEIDNKRMFIQIGLVDQEFFYSIHMVEKSKDKKTKRFLF